MRCLSVESGHCSRINSYHGESPMYGTMSLEFGDFTCVPCKASTGELKTPISAVPVLPPAFRQAEQRAFPCARLAAKVLVVS